MVPSALILSLTPGTEGGGNRDVVTPLRLPAFLLPLVWPVRWREARAYVEKPDLASGRSHHHVSSDDGLLLEPSAIRPASTRFPFKSYTQTSWPFSTACPMQLRVPAASPYGKAMTSVLG